MKKTFAVIAVMMAAVMAVIFFGCGKKDEGNYFEEFPTYVEGAEIETIDIDQNPTAKIEFETAMPPSLWACSRSTTFMRTVLLLMNSARRWRTSARLM